MSKNVKNSEKKNVQNVELVVNEHTFTRTNGKPQIIHTISNWQDYFVDNFQRVNELNALSMAQTYTNIDAHTIVATQKKSDDDVTTDIETANTKFGTTSHWKAVWSYVVEKRNNNTFYAMTYDNELVVELVNNTITLVLFYSARFVDIDATYDGNKRETASGDERTTHSKKFNVETCESVERLDEELNRLQEQVAAVRSRQAYLKSDEYKSLQADKKVSKQCNLDKLNSDDDILRAIAMLQSKLSK